MCPYHWEPTATTSSAPDPSSSACLPSPQPATEISRTAMQSQDKFVVEFLRNIRNLYPIEAGDGQLTSKWKRLL
jgi:hypothetical protein